MAVASPAGKCSNRSRHPGVIIPGSPVRFGALTLIATTLLTGCSLFNRPVPSVPPTALSWLANWVSHPVEMEAFDLELIKPPVLPPPIAVGNLLEITVWDLYEPGKPHTFPVRVSPQQKIAVPLLEEFEVGDRTIPELELALVESYQSGEFLLHPRVLVRSLDAPQVKVHVAGAVNRPGYAQLAREETNAYAALVSAGGLRKNAGTQIAVTRRSDGQADSTTSWYDVTRADERQALKQLVLAAGDTVMVKATTPPLRIGGVVARPGTYALPPGRVLNVWQALDLAGGVQVQGVPLNVTLYRPASDVRSPQRWSQNVETMEDLPEGAPTVEPGDILHVEPTTGSKISRSVQKLWK